MCLLKNKHFVVVFSEKKKTKKNFGESSCCGSVAPLVADERIHCDDK